jgi:hypothetical protein
MSDTITMQFKLKGVELLRTMITQPVVSFSPTEFQFDISLESRIDPSQKLIFVVTTADVRSDNKPEQLAVVSAVCIFGIDNFEDIVKIRTDNQFEVNDEIMLILISISLSTLRGIMFEQFRGTFLHTAVLPIIDPKQFTMQKK